MPTSPLPKKDDAMLLKNRPEFEAGRQDVIADLEKTINFRLSFTEKLVGVTENVAYSQEKISGIIQTYKEILGTLAIQKSKIISEQRYAELPKQLPSYPSLSNK